MKRTPFSSLAPGDPIDQQASAWVVANGEPNLTDEERRAFELWRVADPRHAERYEAMSRAWGDVTQLKALASLVDPAEGMSPRRWPTYRRFAATAAAAAAILIVFLLATGRIPSGRAGEQYATALAEVRQVTLSDGSVVTLGPRSSLAIAFTQGERRVRLAGGEAFFEVTHNPARPFLVEAGATTVRVVGTKFDVSHGAGTVRVAVLEGLVTVNTPFAAARDGAARTRFLHPGERVEIASLGEVARPSVALAALPTPAAGAWRQGRMVYDNARLGDLIADVNRYYGPGVRLDDPQVAEQRITAAFRTDEIPAFLSTLGDVIPVTVAERQGGRFELGSRHR